MIRALLATLDPRTARLNRVQLVRIAVFAGCEGLAYGLTLPLIAALVRGELAGRWLLGVVLATVTTMLARQWQIRGGVDTALATIPALQSRLARHVASLPVGWFTPTRTGSLPQTLSWGAITAGRGVPYSLIAMVGGVVTPAVVLISAALVDWRPALVMLVAVPVLWLVHGRTSAALDRLEARTHAAGAEATARVVEFADTQATLRAAGREGLGAALLRDALDEQYAAARADVGREILARAGFGVAVNLVVAAVVAVIGWVLLRDPSATAVLVALLVLTIRFSEPIAGLGDAARGMRQGRTALRRITELLAEPALAEPAEPRTLPSGPLSVEFDQVRHQVLDLSLTVPAGSTVALIGASGAGKSTALSLVARFADPEAGSVRLGGIDLRELRAAELYGSLGVVLQEVVLLDGTIRENLLLGGGDPARLDEVAALTGVDEVVGRLGWDAPVGEGGQGLSGGERQRIALARTVLADPPVVLLDEATSALDPVNERMVGRTIAALSGRRTLLVVAHRLSTIAGADRIVVLDRGRIVEQGAHAELLAGGGLYARMWRNRTAAQGLRPVGALEEDHA
ncbi:ABC transporter ATP-binding protein [Pseudonocardia sp. HH130630-07]|uniref:ABC transporter ATP-binding protein n=1 Tax=Pseudonocardia sp. HH130630-07 TaxID=1690815 RepID=UPI0008151BF6|nr:ABC transporter ATP-binding protein [Pseudonocardia sp. HH130630-07]ANY07721.1 hypothetical protein AFB00_17080 [Pseudonocardia sp. HH130630-07]